ncbi:MAG: hypothetical protein QXO47_10450 [Thermoproteota archaeon]
MVDAWKPFLAGVVGGVLGAVGVAGIVFLASRKVQAQPEPFASLTDTVTAAQYMENAIHASTGSQAASNIGQAITQLQHAAAYLQAASSLQPSGSYVLPTQASFSQLLEYTNSLISTLQAYQATVSTLSGSSLTDYQQKVLYQFQGSLSYLYTQLELTLFHA